MSKSRHDIVIDGLNGRIIDDYIEGWVFRVEEVSPNIYRVDGEDVNGYTAHGVGIDPDVAFDACIKNVKRIIFFQSVPVRIKGLVRRLIKFGK